MTGRYYIRTGVYNTRFGGDTMQTQEVTLAEVLRERGYRTGIFGKWHLGRYAPHRPVDQGFDEALTFSHGHLERYDHPDGFTHNGEPVQCRGYITDMVTEAAMQFIETSGERPFFCYLPYNVPHEPMIVGHAVHMQKQGEALLRKYLARGLDIRVANIYGMIERCDQNIGRLLELLDERKLADNTVVFFLSDNGGIHKAYKAGLRGGKASVYEGGVRSPFFARWPGHFPAGAKSDSIATHVDLLPTICALTGATIPNDGPIDGRSILSLLQTGKGESPQAYVYHTWNRYYPRDDQNWAIGSQRYKLANGRLFDLENDPGEMHDIASKHPELVKTLRAEFDRWFQDVTKGQSFRPISIPLGMPEENPVELQASWATIEGQNANYTFLGYDWDTIDGWRDSSDTATWKLNVVQPGRYEVKLSYGAAPRSDGGKLRLKFNEQQREYVVRPTVTPNVFVVRDVGTVELAKGPLILQALPGVPCDGELMRLNRIWLRRVE